MPDRADKQQVGALGFTRSPSEDDPRRDPRLLASIARVAPGTAAEAGHRRHHPLARRGADRHRRPGGARVPLLGRHASRHQLHGPAALRAVEDGRRDHRQGQPVEDRVRERPADAGSDDLVQRDRNPAPDGRARGEADRRPRHLDLAAAGDGDDLPGAAALPARPRPDRARQDEPGSCNARHVPHASRAGADAAHCARVPECGCPRRRPRRPPAGGADDANGRGDRAELRRARRRRPPDQDAAD